MRGPQADPLLLSPRAPIRTCIGCHSRRPQSELVRLRSAEGTIVVEAAGRRGSGRGAYICANMECRKVVLKRGTLHRALRQEMGGFDQSAVAAALAGMICDSPPGISRAIPSGAGSEEEPR